MKIGPEILKGDFIKVSIFCPLKFLNYTVSFKFSIMYVTDYRNWNFRVSSLNTKLKFIYNWSIINFFFYKNWIYQRLVSYKIKSVRTY